LLNWICISTCSLNIWWNWALLSIWTKQCLLWWCHSHQPVGRVLLISRFMRFILYILTLIILELIPFKFRWLRSWVSFWVIVLIHVSLNHWISTFV
jgi:hypothetical protein